MRELGDETFTRQILIVQRVVGKGLRNRRLGPGTVLNKVDIRSRKIVLPIVRAIVCQALVVVTQGRRQILGDRRGDAQREAFFRIVIVIVARRLVLKISKPAARR